MIWPLLPLLHTLDLVSDAHAGTPTMHPGLWEIAITLQMPGVTKGFPPQTGTQCLAAKDLDDPKKLVPQTGPCTVADYVMKDGTATWSFSCEGAEGVHGTSTITLTETTFTASSTVSMRVGTREQQSTMSYAGKRLGDCP